MEEPRIKLGISFRGICAVYNNKINYRKTPAERGGAGRPPLVPRTFLDGSVYLCIGFSSLFCWLVVFVVVVGVVAVVVVVVVAVVASVLGAAKPTSFEQFDGNQSSERGKEPP